MRQNGGFFKRLDIILKRISVKISALYRRTEIFFHFLNLSTTSLLVLHHSPDSDLASHLSFDTLVLRLGVRTQDTSLPHGGLGARGWEPAVVMSNKQKSWNYDKLTVPLCLQGEPTEQCSWGSSWLSYGADMPVSCPGPNSVREAWFSDYSI